MYNDAINSKKFIIETLTVGTAGVLSSAINISNFSKLSFAFRATTFAGTPNATDFVKIDKIVASRTGAFAGEEVIFNSADDFVLSLDKMSVKNNADIGKNGGRNAINGIYSFVKIGFISSVNGNTIAFTAVLEGARKEPVA